MINDLQKHIIINTIMPYHPVRIGIFGSMARGENTDNSDIDILYLLKDAVGLFKIILGMKYTHKIFYFYNTVKYVS